MTAAKKLMNTKLLVLMALFIALSFAGSFVRIFGTIAFDSLPGFLAALMLGPTIGAVIGFLGHLFTAANSGFPLSFPLHAAIAAAMAVTMFGYGAVYIKLINKLSESATMLITGITGIILNAPVSLAFSMGVLYLMAGREAALGLLIMLPALVLASSVNVIISIILYKSLGKIWNKTL